MDPQLVSQFGLGWNYHYTEEMDMEEDWAERSWFLYCGHVRDVLKMPNKIGLVIDRRFEDPQSYRYVFHLFCYINP